MNAAKETPAKIQARATWMVAYARCTELASFVDQIITRILNSDDRGRDYTREEKAVIAQHDAAMLDDDRLFEAYITVK